MLSRRSPKEEREETSREKKGERAPWLAAWWGAGRGKKGAPGVPWCLRPPTATPETERGKKERERGEAQAIGFVLDAGREKGKGGPVDPGLSRARADPGKKGKNPREKKGGAIRSTQIDDEKKESVKRRAAPPPPFLEKRKIQKKERSGRRTSLFLSLQHRRAEMLEEKGEKGGERRVAFDDVSVATSLYSSKGKEKEPGEGGGERKTGNRRPRPPNLLRGEGKGRHGKKREKACDCLKMSGPGHRKKREEKEAGLLPSPFIEPMSRQAQENQKEKRGRKEIKKLSYCIFFLILARRRKRKCEGEPSFLFNPLPKR